MIGNKLEILNARGAWDDVFFENTASNIDIIYENWLALFLPIIDHFVPSIIVMICLTDKPWMNAGIRVEQYVNVYNIDS